MIELNGTGLLAPRSALESRERTSALTETEARQITNTVTFLQERLAELENATEGWFQFGGESEHEFSRDGLKKIVALSRLMFLKNPLINRAVTIQAFYVWGQGAQIAATHPDVNNIVQTFMDDVKNKAELTAHQTRTETEQTLQVEGNLVFVLFTNPKTGRVRVRTIPIDEIDDIITNPEDAREPWYYKRSWTQTPLSGPGVVRQTVYYPDWRYQPGSKPATINGDPIEWATPVYHVKVGGLKGMRFGVPETYAAIDWARAYKSFLENWATITQAYARFAFKATAPGGARGVAAAKTRLSTTIGSDDRREHNPAPVTGSTFVAAAGSGADLTPIRTAGATTSAADGRNLLLMVAAATGLPEFFFGDANVGNHATAKTLDRPTELKFTDRQTLWADVLRDILGYVVDQAVIAGQLKGTVGKDDEGERLITLAADPATGESMDRSISVEFPPILEHSVLEQTQAIISAMTLDGKQPVLDSPEMMELALKLMFQALGVQDADEVLDRLLPKDAEGNLLPLPTLPPGAPGSDQAPQDGQQPPNGQSDQQPAAEAVRDLVAPADLGNPIDLRPDEIGMLAEVGPEDAARAESLWKAATGGTDLEGLLGATSEDDDA
jgi:hypothetical protein